jgi:hypothetical protein
MNIPLKRSRTYWTTLLLASIILVLIWQVGSVDPWLCLLLIAPLVAPMAIDLYPNYIVQYELTDTEITARVLSQQYHFPKDEYTFEVGQVKGFALRTFGVGLGNFNFGHYTIGGRPVFVIGSSLSGEVLFVSNREKTFVLTPDIDTWENR